MILQAEGRKAVENLDEILDVPGVDVVFVGPYDLSSSLGHVGEIDHPEVVECIKGIIAKANAKGVKLGCFADTVEGGMKWRDLGVKFIGYTSSCRPPRPTWTLSRKKSRCRKILRME